MLSKLYVGNNVSILVDEHDREGVMLPMKTVTLDIHPLTLLQPSYNGCQKCNDHHLSDVCTMNEIF
jgi:hypothetical protein